MTSPKKVITTLQPSLPTGHVFTLAYGSQGLVYHKAKCEAGGFVCQRLCQTYC